MKENIVELIVRARVPANLDAADTQNILEELIGEGQHACEHAASCDNSNQWKESAARALSADITVCTSEVVKTSGTDLACQVDVDKAIAIGDDSDTVYFQVFKDEDGSYWMSAIVDCDTAFFCGPLVTATGPYDSYSEAAIAGLDTATDWCEENSINYQEGCRNLCRMLGEER